MDSVFFWLSKLGWFFVQPGSVIIFLVILVWLLLGWGRYRGARWLTGFLVFVLSFITLFPVGSWLVRPLEIAFEANPQLPAKVDGIILLGGTVNAVGSKDWQQPELYSSAEREFAFLSLARRYPEARLVFTGGSASLHDQTVKEADYARMLFADQGLDLARVTFEDQARNTYENATLSKALIKPARGEYWVLVTSASHMRRAVGAFCQQKWPVMPYPVDHQAQKDFSILPSPDFAGHLHTLHWAMREWLGVWVYHYTGRTKPVSQQCLPD